MLQSVYIQLPSPNSDRSTEIRGDAGFNPGSAVTTSRVRPLLSPSLISWAPNRTCSISARARYVLPSLSFPYFFSFSASRNRFHHGQYRIFPETVYRDNSIFYPGFSFHLPYFLHFSLFISSLDNSLNIFNISRFRHEATRMNDVTCPNRNSGILFE